MLLGVPLSEIAWLALAIVVGGVITGLLAGLFGIGGGAVIVPVLYEVFTVLDVPEAVRMQLCIGTSIASEHANMHSESRPQWIAPPAPRRARLTVVKGSASKQIP